MIVKRGVENLGYQQKDVSKMRGGGERTMFLVIASIFVMVFLLITILVVIHRATAREELYDRMANPLVFGSKKISLEVIKGHKKFLEEALSIFNLGEMERECSRWYKSCTKDVDNAPSSPWSRLDLSEDDVQIAARYLDINCKTPEIENIKKRWANSNNYFAKKTELEQYNLIKNACLSILIDRIYK